MVLLRIVVIILALESAFQFLPVDSKEEILFINILDVSFILLEIDIIFNKEAKELKYLEGIQFLVTF